jgi:hypothetical protein
MEAPMEYTITGISPERLEEKVALYKKLTAQRDELEKRLENVEQQKASVENRIYEKVKFEYTGELKNVRAQLSPVEKELEETKREGEKELAELNEQIRRMEEELAEAEFRHRVGEFDTDKLVEIRNRLNPELTEKTERQADVANRLDTIRSGGFDKTGTTAVEPEETDTGSSGKRAKSRPAKRRTAVKEPLEVEESVEATDADGATDRETVAETLETDDAAEATESIEAEDSLEENTADTFSFENPQDWIDEFGEEKTKEAPRTKTKSSLTHAETPTDSNEAVDPLSALADPSDEQHDEETGTQSANPPVTHAAEEEREVCTGFPNLVIVSGPNSGRKVPLLPMTMSIGREHDNNIELKDPEVARYHARILFERGQFVLEDLESSNGTWLNGEPIKQTGLKNGDRVKIGDTEMVIDFD